jgi:5'-deoxynucleotidase YfbR-like HD superfamily hydrolase
MTTPYLLTASGQRYRLTGPELDTPRIGDIAHHLAQINRFTGAASRPYSVAEHSLLCEHIAASEGAGPLARLCALMHDAHEAYTSDMATPVKLAIRAPLGVHNVWEYFENVHANHVRSSFGLFAAFAEQAHLVKRWDLIALATERRDLMPADDGDGWEILRGVEPLVPSAMPFGFHDYHDWFYWRDNFIEQYSYLATAVMAAES